VSEEEEGEGRESVYQLESVHLHQSSSVEIVLISRVSRNILRVVAQDLCRVLQDIAMLPHSMDTLHGSMNTRQRSREVQRTEDSREEGEGESHHLLIQL
jgi:hypothetical protein